MKKNIKLLNELRDYATGRLCSRYLLALDHAIMVIENGDIKKVKYEIESYERKKKK